jgi:hypothetical protein
MSGNVVSLIALVPMLIHSILGCCWHHAHSHSGQDHVVAVMIDGDSSPDHAHAGHSSCQFHGSPISGGEHHSDDHPAESPCDEDRCVYSGVAAAVVTQLVSLEMWGFTHFILADPQVLQQSRLTAWGAFRDMSFSHSARERRALTQVWLI